MSASAALAMPPDTPAWARVMFLEMAALREAYRSARPVENHAAVVTLAEVQALANCRSPKATRTWLRNHAPRARCGHGRYTRRAVLAGIEAEARIFRRTP